MRRIKSPGNAKRLLIQKNKRPTAGLLLPVKKAGVENNLML